MNPEIPQHTPRLPRHPGGWQQPVFTTLLGVQAALAVARAVVGDICGALAVAAVTSLGCMALAPRGDDVDQGYAFCYGPVACLQALFDMLLVVDYASQLWPSWHSGWVHVSPMVAFKALVAVLCPIVELLTGTLCYSLLKCSSDENSGERTSLMTFAAAAASRQAYRAVGTQTAEGERPLSAEPYPTNVVPPDAKPEPKKHFVGTPRRLGEVLSP
eukprot:CAMPEP_0172671026 /NCGR_PEP_ID=MMETSP1074-20121228/10656_1 /TAXON_ID=2916 /ORGANISM="Ceratium fusus, Strain PA161109" /LENGTH=214 /DNA_ID=CAMNT_0013488009 /DNA_START=18 /DNA_END=662 /DNA_ORIENTATION=-